MSCSDVCLDMDPDGSNDFFSVSTVKARKPHKCCECGDAIPVGARYERASGKSEGDVWTATTCIICAEIRDAFVCGGWIYGNLEDEMREYMFPMGLIYLAPVTKLTGFTKETRHLTPFVFRRMIPLSVGDGAGRKQGETQWRK